MISRFDFMRDSIASDNPTYDLTHHFNEISVVYNLIGGRSDTDILATTKKGKFGFSILLEREEEARLLRSRCDGSKYSVYGETYLLRAKMPKADTVYLRVIKMKKEAL